MAPAEYGVGDIFFAFDKYDLDREAMSILSANARALREADVVVMISGHCDERGTVEYNMALGEKRALAVRDYLVSLGVPARNLRTTSYGKSKPFAWGHNEAAWAKNRRAHFERP
ncbi:peptidoglycan-associated lipoprotein [bacterium DOLJORAL78_65_58]|nr:MAG: peptidoglycan-associated lipoprotein [bacterium DOLZORAL124_64_63]PIE75953.1 MAG: peptidoglycan-associated lipoprotein [bacterium DOLJORAL78_65_58]